MLIGAMNHPAEDPLLAMGRISDLGFSFIDLTLEPPEADPSKLSPQAIRNALSEFELSVVGHTAYYLPIASPIAELRQAALRELERCIEFFGQVGATWVNVHPDKYAPFDTRESLIARNLDSLHHLLEKARKCGVGLMLENVPGGFNSANELCELLDPLPALGLHLDIGHSNLTTPLNTAPTLLDRYGSRLRHVHLHDNKGGSLDLHLPLGAGTIPIAAMVRALKNSGYDGTITLEVFSPNYEYLRMSKEILQRLWDTDAEIRDDTPATAVPV